MASDIEMSDQLSMAAEHFQPLRVWIWEKTDEALQLYSMATPIGAKAIILLEELLSLGSITGA